MKRRIIAMVLALLIMIAPVSANSLGISVSQGQAQKGETVVVEVRLTEELTTKSGSIELEYDHDVLTVESYTWYLEGALLQFFDPATGQGAFACMYPIQVGDLIFSVIFRVAEDANYGQQDVAVNMGFTNNENPDDNVQVEDVPGDIYVGCDDHQGGGATCTEPDRCTICGAVVGQALGHSFGETTFHRPTPESQGYSQHSCSTCGLVEQFDFVPFRGGNVSGTITSYLADGDITVELLQDGEVAYSAQVSGKTVDYVIEGVYAGAYTLRVSKANHVSREYEIVVGDESLTQDAKICPVGDVTGDGTVNVKDFQRLLRHVNKTSLLSGYALACGDVTNEGSCNVKDFQRLLRHVNKTNPLF